MGVLRLFSRVVAAVEGQVRVGASIALLVVPIVTAPSTWAQQATQQSTVQTGSAAVSHGESVTADDQTPRAGASDLEQRVGIYAPHV